MDVAHELRTPLMAIQSTVEAIVDGVFEPNEERLGTINLEVRRLGRLVDALLRLSRLESRSTPMNEEVINVGELIRPWPSPRSVRQRCRSHSRVRCRRRGYGVRRSRYAQAGHGQSHFERGALHSRPWENHGQSSQGRHHGFHFP
ncbi:MAG: histidine kinase dimerization/phospho-acceptor domain-containing protein [Slackia sp.]